MARHYYQLKVIPPNSGYHHGSMYTEAQVNYRDTLFSEADEFMELEYFYGPSATQDAARYIEHMKEKDKEIRAMEFYANTMLPKDAAPYNGAEEYAPGMSPDELCDTTYKWHELLDTYGGKAFSNVGTNGA